MSYDVNVILNEIEEFTPDTGFNLVGIDNFEKPGDMLYLIGHFDTMDEAKKEKEKHGPNTVIYYKSEKNI